MKDMLYYEKKRKNNALYVHYLWYTFIFTCSHGCMIFSIYLFMRWSKDITQWSFFTAPIIYIILMLFDKLWFVAFFSLKSKRLIILCALLIFLLSVAYTTVCIVSGNLEEVTWLPPVLTVPFNIMALHLLALSHNWKF